jgi:hypothetical protein
MSSIAILLNDEDEPEGYKNSEDIIEALNEIMIESGGDE